MESTAEMFKQHATQLSMSYSSSNKKDRSKIRASDPAKLKSGVSANDLAERLHTHKTKTEAKLEKERRDKVRKELETIADPHINHNKLHKKLESRTPIYGRIDEILD